MNFAFKPEASASATLNLVLLFLDYYFFHQKIRTETRLTKKPQQCAVLL